MCQPEAACTGVAISLVLSISCQRHIYSFLLLQSRNAKEAAARLHQLPFLFGCPPMPKVKPAISRTLNFLQHPADLSNQCVLQVGQGDAGGGCRVDAPAALLHTLACLWPHRVACGPGARCALPAGLFLSCPLNRHAVALICNVLKCMSEP